MPSAYYVHKNLEMVPAVAAEIGRLRPSLSFEFALTLDSASSKWAKIHYLAKQLGVAHRISTLGVVPLAKLAQAYREASAVFLPTLREISTAVYPESFFFRRPLVTSDMDFARELCGQAAIFVPALDPQRSALRLVELAEFPRMRSQLVAEGSRQLATYPSARQKYDLQRELLFRVADTRSRT